MLICNSSYLKLFFSIRIPPVLAKSSLLDALSAYIKHNTHKEKGEIHLLFEHLFVNQDSELPAGERTKLLKPFCELLHYDQPYGNYRLYTERALLSLIKIPLLQSPKYGSQFPSNDNQCLKMLQQYISTVSVLFTKGERNTPLTSFFFICARKLIMRTCITSRCFLR